MEHHRGIIRINRRMAEALTAAAVLAAVIVLFIHSFSLPPSPMRGYPGPAFVPQIILIFTAVFTVLWLFRLVLAGRQRSGDDALADSGLDEGLDDGGFDFEYRDYFLTIATVLAFVIGLAYLGFEVTCFAITFFLLYPRLSSPLSALLAAAATTSTIYVVFALLLNVSIPLAFLPSYIAF